MSFSFGLLSAISEHRATNKLSAILLSDLSAFLNSSHLKRNL